MTSSKSSQTPETGDLQTSSVEGGVPFFVLIEICNGLQGICRFSGVEFLVTGLICKQINRELSVIRPVLGSVGVESSKYRT